MRFIPAINAHSEVIQELVFGVLREYGLKPDPDATDRDLLDIQAAYADAGGCFELLVGDDEELVGCYGLFPLGRGVCELRKMYLRREFRGRGLGKEILRRALDRARSLGFRRVQLETALVLTEAIRLYESFGFKPFQPEHMSARCDLAMHLELDGET